MSRAEADAEALEEGMVSAVDADVTGKETEGSEVPETVQETFLIQDLEFILQRSVTVRLPSLRKVRQKNTELIFNGDYAKTFFATATVSIASFE